MGKRTQAERRAADKAAPAAAPDVPLAEQQDSKVFAAQTKEAKKNQKIKALVMKSLRDTFKDMSEAEIYHIYDPETGRNMFQQIWHDKELYLNKAADAPKFGSLWSTGIRAKYARNIEDANDLLDVQDEEVLPDPILVAAMDLSRAPVPNREKLIHWLQKAIAKCNQTEMVGLCLHMNEMKPWLAGSQFVLIMEFTQ